MKKTLPLLLCAAGLLSGWAVRAEVHRGKLDLEGGLTYQIDGVTYFEADTHLKDSPAGFGNPVFSVQDNSMRYLQGFTAGLDRKSYCFSLPVPGQTVSISAKFRSIDCTYGEDQSWMTLMVTPMKMAYAAAHGGNWAHGLDDQVIFRETEGAAGDVLTLEASFRYKDSWDGVVINLCAGGEDGRGAVIICFYDDNKETVVVTDEAGDESGEEDGDGGGGKHKFPWKWVIPGAIGGGIVVSQLPKGKKPKGKKGKPEKKKEQKREEEDRQRGSEFRMVLWKNCGSTLTVGDPPVQMGARIEEITADGRRVDRPDLTAMVSIFGEPPVVVENKRREGPYMKADVSVQEEAEQVKVTFVFNGPSLRFVRHWVFQVEGAPAILVEPAITFAAGQGKTLFMEFGLLGALRNPESLEVRLEKRAAPFFSAELEQDGGTPGLFRVHLTEHGPADQVPGTMESYECFIEARSPGGKAPVRESFTIYRIHLGLRLEIRALKGYLVELESTPDNDIMPPKGSKRRRKYAESRVDWQLLVVDEQKGGQVRSVRPDVGPFFTFEDDFRDNMLFLPKDGDQYVPSVGDYAAYDGAFFRSFDGQGVPSPCETLKFEYGTVGAMPDGGYWGIIRATNGYLVSPNRSHVKVKVRMNWRGKEYTRELRVPLNSQPFRQIEIPEGGDLVTELHKWDKRDLERKENLMDMQRKICLDTRFAELRPLFYKVTVMLEAHDPAFGFDDEDYENLMDIWRKYCSGEIGTYFAAKQGLSPDDENFEAAIATIAAMDKSIPAIACRIGLGIVTGGTSEIVLTPLSALAEMKEYVDQGGDSAFGAFVQTSVKLVAVELLFAHGGKILGKVKDFTKSRIQQSQFLSAQFRRIGDGMKKVTERAKVTLGLAERPAFSSAKNADKITRAGSRTKQVLKSSQDMADDAIRSVKSAKESAALKGARGTESVKGPKAPLELVDDTASTVKNMADDAIRDVRSNPSLYTKESRLAEEAAKRARADGQKLVDDFRRVMNNPTASEEEIRRVTLALQGNKSAQNILRTQQSDMLRANFNAQMQKVYNDLDPDVIKRLEDKLMKRGLTERPKIRPFKGATGNAGEELRLGKKIGADRDVTYQIWDERAKDWVDLPEDLMEEAYSESLNMYQYKFIPKEQVDRVKTMLKADQAVVNGKFGLESYGDDLGRIIDPARQGEKLADPERIAKTYIHKCQEWLKRGAEARKQAESCFAYGYDDDGLRVLGYSEALVEEGIRQGVKQFKRILAPRIEAALAKGASINYQTLMAKIRVLDSLAVPTPKGAIAITLEEARLVLKNKFNTTIEEVVEECGKAILDVNAVL